MGVSSEEEVIARRWNSTRAQAVSTLAKAVSSASALTSIAGADDSFAMFRMFEVKR